jgi:polysaccharide biosynthesis/export protein
MSMRHVFTTSDGRARTAFLLAFTLAGCSTVPTLPPAPPTPGPTAAVTPVPQQALYQIQVGDVLALRLMLNPELNEDITVRPDGHISTTLVSDAVASGLTVPQLTADLRRDYAKDLKDPRLNVVVKSFAPTRIYVGGEVNNPGEFITVGPTLTLSQAIARAGGLKISSADDAKIYIIRRGPGDTPEMLGTTYNKVMRGQNPMADIRLAPYDLVYVPRSGAAEVYIFLNQYFLQFVPVNWGFSYVVGSSGSNSVIPVK